MYVYTNLVTPNTYVIRYVHICIPICMYKYMCYLHISSCTILSFSIKKLNTVVGMSLILDKFIRTNKQTNK